LSTPSEQVPSAPGPSYEVHIERGKIREFAAAMQSDDPAYQGEHAVIPPTFLATAALWAPPGARVGHGFDRARLLHGEQEFVFHAPLPHAGQVLHASEHVADRYEKEGKRGGTMRFAVLVTEFRDDAGALVAESRSTLIERAAPPKKDDA
jgi:N-terminal half of MaoC dehydratase